MSTENFSKNNHPDKTTIFKQLNTGILSERLYAFESNVKKNGPLIKKWGGLAHIIHDLSSKHVIIAGAGVSLQQTIPLLKKIQHRDSIVIIAVDMAYAALIKSGINPGYVISCESSPRLFFHGLPTDKSTLIAFSCASPTNIRSWKGSISFYNWMIRQEPYETLWKLAGFDLGFVATGSVVTTQALSLVMGLAPRSIMLCGNDLAFRDLPYVKGALWYDMTTPHADRFNTAETQSRMSVWKARQFTIKRGERDYSTNNQFLGAKYWIEDILQQSSVTILDISDPGLSGKYVEKISPRQYESRILETSRRKRRRR